MVLLLLLLLLLLQRVEGAHAGQGKRTVAAGRRCAIGFLVRGWVVVLRVGERGRRVGGRTWVAYWLLTVLALLLLGIRHRW